MGRGYARYRGYAGNSGGRRARRDLGKQQKTGAAYVRVISEYVIQKPCPGSVPKAYTAGCFGDMEKMRLDIEALKTRCDAVVVHFHM